MAPSREKIYRTDKLGYKSGSGTMKYLFGGGHLLDLAVAHHCHLISHEEGFLLVVRHKYCGNSIGPEDFHHVTSDLFAQARVQVGEGFVQQ
jgi:hypothetical protein